MCGSSARKLKRGKGNLLGGRAFRRQLWGLSSHELGSSFELERALNIGSLPRAWIMNDPKELLRSYALDYLREEVSAEALVKRLDSFSQFLGLAALSDTETLSYSTIARDVGVSQPTIRSYFEILEETMIGHFLPAFRVRPKRRLTLSPKFYFFDVGVVNFLTKRGKLEPGSELFGRAFENWVHHELRCFQSCFVPDLDISYWRSGLLEVVLSWDLLRSPLRSKPVREFSPITLRDSALSKVIIPIVKSALLFARSPKLAKVMTESKFSLLKSLQSSCFRENSLLHSLSPGGSVS